MIKIIAVLGLGLTITGASVASVRWGDHGHRISARAAAQGLPGDMPEFFRAAVAELEYLNPEPDRWRADSFPEMRDAFRYDHFVDFELVPDSILRAESRWDFLSAVQRAGLEQPVNVGLLPYQIVELHQRLTTEFMRWRRTPDARERAWIEQRILQDAGILGHYVTDGANPHHTTMHHNGWAPNVPNPRNYTTDRTFHRRFESEFVEARVSAPDVVGAMQAPPKRIANVRAETLEYLQRSHGRLQRLYELEMQAAFGPDNRADTHRLFAIERLAAGAVMLRDLWWSAWLDSAMEGG